jgi:F-type H+-transporting ATPase subunit epsilon
MSGNTFLLQIMASDHMVYDGKALSVTLPTTEGSVGILAQHSNVIMAVIPGLIEYEHDGGREQIVVSDGLLKVENGEVMILVDTAEKPEDIDEARAKRAEEEAREALKKANSNRDHAMVEAELSRALSRIKASKTKHSL